jgi:flagellin-like hook-associated protein FlgL
LLDLADALLDEANTELYSGEATSLISELSDQDVAAILAVNPGLTYFPGNRSFYMLGGVANWATSNANSQAATINEPPGVSGVQGVTGHLANITSQEENDFINALAPGNVWLGGGDGPVEGEWRWLAGPEAGQQFWQGGVGGSTVGGSYANWGGGEPNNSGNEDTVHMRADGRWNDQPGGTAYNYVIEWDSSLFTPPVDPNLVARAEEYARQYAVIMDQIDKLAKDTHFRGIGLLKNENLRTDFNIRRTSYLTTEGMDATSFGLGLSSRNFMRLTTLNLAQDQVHEARIALRTYSADLAVDFNIISARLDFTEETIGVHKSGASDLVDANKNEAGSELLALQVRRQLQMEALRLSTKSDVGRLFE